VPYRQVARPLPSTATKSPRQLRTTGGPPLTSCGSITSSEKSGKITRSPALSRRSQFQILHSRTDNTGHPLASQHRPAEPATYHSASQPRNRCGQATIRRPASGASGERSGNRRRLAAVAAGEAPLSVRWWSQRNRWQPSSAPGGTWRGNAQARLAPWAGGSWLQACTTTPRAAHPG